jgi:hypothetical protein
VFPLASVDSITFGTPIGKAFMASVMADIPPEPPSPPSSRPSS